MSKILSSVLDKVSENNNEYRLILRKLNSDIDEKTTTLIGDVVTLSSYMVDFSNALAESKEKLVNPISRIIESYVIKDLRSVETVNEQFIEKINDKLENSNINSKEEQDTFTNNLKELLNNKYLEIVKIKRVDFLNENGKNEEIEKIINDYKNYIISIATFEEDSLNELISNYSKSLYNSISKTLIKISDLYLNNFVSEVSSALNAAIDFDDTNVYSENKIEDSKPFIPDINPVPEIEIPQIPETPVEEPKVSSNEVPFIPSIPEVSAEDLSTNIEEEQEELEPKENEEQLKPMDVKAIKPIEINDEQKKEIHKRPYDVEEILKIAKSPVVSMPKENNESHYVNVSPIVEEHEKETLDSEFNEKEIVEEMIKRLSNRLKEIDERNSKYVEEKSKLEEDEAFVNDLIESSNKKREELDKFENELDEKQKELDEKQKELDRKINDVMPFADAVLKTEKES